MRSLLAFAVATLACACAAAAQPTEVRFRVSDDVSIVGDLYRAAAPADVPAILLFHQGGGDARGEYAPIIPRLLGAGFHVLSVDVRGGGDRFGGSHRVPAPPEFRYCEAIADVGGALSLARREGLLGPLILWGSSYTGTLVIHVAARRTADVRAVLAFSPAGGEPMEECPADAVSARLQRANVPLLVVRASGEVSIPGVQERLDRLAATGARTFIAQGDGHGSSILVADRFQGSVEPQWSEVSSFLRAARMPRVPDSSAVHVVIPSGGWELHGDRVSPSVGDTAVPYVLLLNKAAGSRRVYAELAHELAARGIGSLRLDLRGHGESTNLGRFIPYDSTFDLSGTHEDVEQALAWLRARSGVDATRLGIVSGSYSAEVAAMALRESARVRAFVALSPGHFSDTSFAALDAMADHWLFVRGNDEAFVGTWLDDGVRASHGSAALLVLPTGAAHATDLLLADPALAPRLADWLAARLR